MSRWKVTPAHRYKMDDFELTGHNHKWKWPTSLQNFIEALQSFEFGNTWVSWDVYEILLLPWASVTLSIKWDEGLLPHRIAVSNERLHVNHLAQSLSPSVTSQNMPLCLTVWRLLCLIVFLSFPDSQKTCHCFPSGPSFSNHYTPLTFPCPLSPLLCCAQSSVWMECQYSILPSLNVSSASSVQTSLGHLCCWRLQVHLEADTSSASLRLSSITAPWINKC